MRLNSRHITPAASSLPPRSGFTLVELMVVMAIISVLAGIAITAMRGAFGAARQNQTQAMIRTIEGTLDERLAIYETGLTNPFYDIEKRTADYSFRAGVSSAVAQFMARKQLRQSVFPQRFQDLCGFDGLPGAPGVDDDMDGTNIDSIAVGIDLLELGLGGSASDDPPTAAAVRTAVIADVDVSDAVAMTALRTRLASHSTETESSELLYLCLTTPILGELPTLQADQINPDFLADTDGDGLQEFVDGWGQPVQFYNNISTLVRPNVWNAASTSPGVHAIDAEQVATLLALVPRLNSNMPAAGLPVGAQHPLNRDGDDRLNVLTPTVFSLPGPPAGTIATSLSEVTADYTAAPNDAITSAADLLDLGPGAGLAAVPNVPGWPGSLRTFSRPLIVSAGPDELLGMGNPTAVGPNRFGRPVPVIGTGTGQVALSGHPILDNITNLQEGP